MRQVLKKEGVLSFTEQTVTRLERLNLTAAQRQGAVNYEPGNVIEFHRRAAGGFKSGEQWRVTEIMPRGGLHIDQGFVVTSHAAQGKTVDQVIASVPVRAFSQANEAQFYHRSVPR